MDSFSCCTRTEIAGSSASSFGFVTAPRPAGAKKDDDDDDDDDDNDNDDDGGRMDDAVLYSSCVLVIRFSKRKIQRSKKRIPGTEIKLVFCWCDDSDKSRERAC